MNSTICESQLVVLSPCEKTRRCQFSVSDTESAEDVLQDMFWRCVLTPPIFSQSRFPSSLTPVDNFFVDGIGRRAPNRPIWLFNNSALLCPVWTRLSWSIRLLEFLRTRVSQMPKSRQRSGLLGSFSRLRRTEVVSRLEHGHSRVRTSTLVVSRFLASKQAILQQIYGRER